MYCALLNNKPARNINNKLEYHITADEYIKCAIGVSGMRKCSMNIVIITTKSDKSAFCPYLASSSVLNLNFLALLLRMLCITMKFKANIKQVMPSDKNINKGPFAT